MKPAAEAPGPLQHLAMPPRWLPTAVAAAAWEAHTNKTLLLNKSSWTTDRLAGWILYSFVTVVSSGVAMDSTVLRLPAVLGPLFCLHASDGRRCLYHLRPQNWKLNKRNDGCTWISKVLAYFSHCVYFCSAKSQGPTMRLLCQPKSLQILQHLPRWHRPRPKIVPF